MSLVVGLTGPLFGGEALPLGSAVGFVERPFGDVIHATEKWFKQIDRRCSVTRLETLPLLETLLDLLLHTYGGDIAADVGEQINAR